MILVLTILVAVLTISYPAMNRLYVGHQLHQGASDVQVRLMAARVRAIEAGIGYQFRYEPGGRRFVALPFDPIAAVAGTPYWKYGGELPPSVNFVSTSLYPGVGQELALQLLSDLPNAAELQGAHWSAPILFKPDGTAGGGWIDIVDKEGDTLRVSVRALTGGVTVARVP